MSRSSVLVLLAIVSAAELVFLGLLLPRERWLALETMVALGGAIVAWAATMGLALGQASATRGAASTLVRWPAVLVGFAWGVLSVFPITFAVELSNPWVIGLHVLAGLACLSVWGTMREAGRHVDQVEAEISRSDETNLAMIAAISRARGQAARANLDASSSQRVRTLLDKAEVLPRSALGAPVGLAVLEAVQKVGAAIGQGREALESVLVELEDLVLAGRRRTPP